MNDAEMFSNNFGKWCEAHGVVLGDHANGKFDAKIDLNELKIAIMRFADEQADSAVDTAQNDLLFDLDEIENKPWRVFRQLGAIMPDYKDSYLRYEHFYMHGGSNDVMKLIEDFEKDHPIV